MSKEKPMGIAAKVPQVRYSAAYPTGRERIAKGSSLPWGLTPLYSARSQEVERSLEGCGIAAVVGGECGGHPRNGIICSI